MKNKRLIGAILGIILCIAVSLIPAPQGLTQTAMITLGITCLAVVFWGMQVLPMFLTSMLMCMLFVVTNCAPFGTVFSPFSGKTYWFIFGVLGIAVALGNSGLIRRLALNIIKRFKPTFKSQVLAQILAGFIVNPIIPSANAKLSIGVPIAIGTAEVMGYEKRSKGMHGLFLGAVVGYMLLSASFLAANNFGIFAFALLPDETQAQFGWLTWFLSMLPWGIVVAVGLYFAIIKMYSPEKGDALPTDFIEKQLKEMGPMQKKEKLTAAVFAVTVVLWATEKIHGIPSAYVSMLSLIVMLCCGSLTVDQFKKQIPWDIIILCGTILSLGVVLQSVGISDYLGVTLSPYISKITGSPFLFVAAVSIFIYILRIVYVDQTSTVNIFVMILVPFAINVGINPFLIAMVVFTSVMDWNMIHQNFLMLTAYSAAGGDTNIDFKQVAKLSPVYMILNILGYFVCIPLWKLFGIL